MRWLSLFASSLLCAGSLAAKKTDVFQGFHAKQLSSTPVKIDDNSYRKLVSTPRDYSAAVLLTAMDARYACQLCREFQPEFDLLAHSWTKGDKEGESRLVFAVLDFNDGRDTFVSLGLQTAPVLLLFPPTSGPHAVADQEPLRYDFANGPGPAEVVQNWLARHLPDRPHPPIKRPINFIAWGTSITLFLGSFTALFVAWPYVLPIIQNRNIWAAISLISILLFISGHMFNHIRKVPYVAGDGRGGISYFAGGFQNQYGMETQLVAGMYGLLSLASISLAVKVPRMVDEKLQQAAALIWGAVLFFMYSFLLSIFRVKNGGYPFSLPPFM
ncbi:malonyl-acyl carrier protein [Niveomyces insectorum RCEF 264]|uniref:Malonyl-acyl carrier protein n=1 Tax=Niveomyces insectorum RCEF 264 TaxID=1081102 RepID=A0A162MC66_9HYPO|nr:malonyl-acyl carrier protein [Niveomyces insectorum RCEF 264]